MLAGSIVISIFLVIADVATGTYDEESGFGVLTTLFSLAIVWPWLASYIKRLHDFDMGGWWVLLFFVPLVNFLWFLVLLFKSGTQGTNSYGQQPAPSFAL